MRILSSIFFLFLLLVFHLFAWGETENDRCHRSTEGTDFWFGFMEGRDKDNRHVHYIEITVTAREATTFSIYLGKSTTPYVTGSVNANGSYQLKIPLELAEATGSETIQDKAIHLVAEKPVNVYALNWDNSSADVAVVYPVESLGKEYFAMCYEPSVDENNLSHGRNSEFLVVASIDSTTVTITPSKITDQGKPAGIPFTILLNKGEVYQVQSLNQNYAGQGDLTGSYIQSDKPVAFYSGNYSTVVPVQQGMGGYDHLFEQIPPVQTWGKEYYAVPLYTRYADRYRILASEDNTTVLVGTTRYIIANSGEFVEFILYFNQPSRIFADKPVLVAQFSQSNETDRSYTGGDGDPFMIILSSVSQSKNDVTFVAYDSNQIENYYVNIVTPSSQINNIELDGTFIGNYFNSFNGTGYSYAQLRIPLGNHTLRNVNEDRGFLAYVYGYGGYESYGYGVGFNLDLILDIGQNIDFEGDTLPMCKGTQVVLDAGPYFDEYLWNTGDTTQKITVNTEGKYWAIGRTIDGCEKKDSIYVILAGKVKPEIGADSAGCAPLSMKLDAGAGFRTYEWNTGDSSQIIQIDKTGEYIITVTDRFWCATRDTMKFTVYPVPEIDMDGDKTICGTQFRKFELDFTGADENMLANGKTEWKTTQPAKLIFSNKTVTATDINVTDWGDYEVSVIFTTPDGCTVYDTFQLRFAEVPTSEIQFMDNPNDKCKGYSREIRYVGNATQNASYYWDFGGCVDDSLAWNIRRVSLGVFNSNPYVSLVVEENGCWSDTTILPIGANPDFVMNTAESRGCDSATIFFSGELKVTDDVVFEWNFGDGSPIGRVQNISHFYADTGKFDVSLVITNVLNGCQAGFTIDEMVKIFPTPTAVIQLDTDFCNDKTAVAVYPLAIDSTICHWSFTGGELVGNQNASVVFRLTEQITGVNLQVEEFGCFSSWVGAKAKRKPLFDFTFNPAEGCQPLFTTGKATSGDYQVLLQWITDTANVSGSELQFLLNEPGNIGFTVTAHSEITGCFDTLFKPDQVLVHPKPEAEFEIDFPVAILEQAHLSFTNQTDDVNKFKWDFGDGSFSELENPQHRFTALGNYLVGLQVESQFGCLDTVFSVVEILPFTAYTPNAFRPDSEIPENRNFMPVTVGVDPTQFTFIIFNRWGEPVFESNSPENKWDGTVKNSGKAPAGNYIWKAEFADVQGFWHSTKGQVLLIR